MIFCKEKQKKKKKIGGTQNEKYVARKRIRICNHPYNVFADCRESHLRWLLVAGPCRPPLTPWHFDFANDTPEIKKKMY